MANSPDFVAHVVELVRGVGAAEAKRMFGGHGIYVDGLIVGIVVDDTLYLKSDEQTRAEFTDRGLAPFVFTSARKGTVETSYYTPPEEALESRAEMLPWLRLALAASRRAAGRRVRRAGRK